MRDFQLELNELREGKREELTVSREEFMLFREIWLTQTDRQLIIGEAGLNGKIIYRLQKPEKTE